jgi:hypothetical protein
MAEFEPGIPARLQALDYMATGIGTFFVFIISFSLSNLICQSSITLLIFKLKEKQTATDAE